VKQGQNIAAQTIPRKTAAVNSLHHLRRIKTAILIFRIVVINREPDGFRNAGREIRSFSIFKGNKLASGNYVSLRIIFLDKAPGATNHIKTHQLTAGIVIKHIHIQFPLTGKPGKGKVAAAEIADGGVNGIRPEEKIEFGVQRVTKKEFNNHLFGFNLGCQPL